MAMLITEKKESEKQVNINRGPEISRVKEKVCIYCLFRIAMTNMGHLNP